MSSGKQYLFFSETDDPLLLDGCDELLPFIDIIMPGWPYQVSSKDRGKSPFFEIQPRDSDGKYFVHAIRKGTDPKTLVPVNAICDVAAALSTEPSFLEKGFLCLHTAAIEMKGRLVLFPNTRRAGKSTLTICMAAHGFPIFTDDYLSLSLSQENHVLGKANGVLPRARLPLPDGVDDLLARGTDLKKSIGNKQYRYVAPFDLPSHGVTSPVGAVVFLDRAEGETTRFETVPPDETVGTLLYQNFGRHVHSGVTLALLSHLAQKLPVLKLKYSEAADAAAFLEDYFSEWSDELPQLDSDDANLVKAPQFLSPASPPPFDPQRAYVASEGTLIKEAGEQTFMSDPDGRVVVKLDPMAKTIWLILQDPMNLPQVSAILAEVFPDVPVNRVLEDTQDLMKWLCRKALIEPVQISPNDP